MKSNKYFMCNRNFILISAMAMSLTFIACHSNHSKVYNEAISSARSYERAIDNASSIDELPWAMFKYNPFDYLEGDEERAIIERRNQLWDKYNAKFDELAIGTYQLVTENGERHVGDKYKLELSRAYGKQEAKLYKNGSLYCNGEWKPSGLFSYYKIEIRFKDGPCKGNEYGWIDINVKQRGWRGKIEINDYHLGEHTNYIFVESDGSFTKSI